MRELACLFALLGALGGCAPGSPGSPSTPGDGKVVFTGDQKADYAQITAIEEQAKAIVRSEGCSTASECRTAPVGSRGCGGPRYYLVYCSRTTDSAALFAKLQAIEAAEREYNARYKIMSTCEFRMPPKIALSGGSCQAQQ